jgi:cytochrome c oxidase cbb3-type subunit I/II
MPRYQWLLSKRYDSNSIPPRISALRKVGVPYPQGYEQVAMVEAAQQAAQIAANLQQNSIQTTSDKEIIALIAYLQRLGTDIKGAPPTEYSDQPTTETQPTAAAVTNQTQQAVQVLDKKEQSL